MLGCEGDKSSSFFFLLCRNCSLKIQQIRGPCATSRDSFRQVWRRMGWGCTTSRRSARAGVIRAEGPAQGELWGLSCLEPIPESVRLGPEALGSLGRRCRGVDPHVHAGQSGPGEWGEGRAASPFSCSLSPFDCWTHRHEGRALCPGQTSPASGEVTREPVRGLRQRE